MARTFNQPLLIGIPAVVLAATLGWALWPGSAETQSGPTDQVSLNTASLDDEAPAVASPVTPAPPAAQPLKRLSISRQSFQRGGLGSKALMTFTVRNRNHFAVKDIELLCKFRSPDGSYATERRRILPDTVEMKSRKVFAMTHIGFVNVRAAKAKCAVVTAERA
ncbi:MAG: hypothetical protein JWQ94_1947 [Tardiphaga sp.]|nr:hypothetical protein [Tardiphaga sp.]